MSDRDEIKIASTTDSDAALLEAVGNDAHMTEESEQAKASEAQQAEQEPQPSRDGKSKSAFQKRIDRLVRERSERDAHIEQLRQENEALRRGTNGSGAPHAAQPGNGNGAGQRETLSELAARLERETQAPQNGNAPAAAAKESPQPDRQQQQWAQEHHGRAAEMDRRIEENPELKREFHQAIAEAKRNGLQLDPVEFHTLVDLPNGEFVATYILQNPDVLEDLHTKPPAEKIAALHRISAGLEFNPPEPRPQSNRRVANAPPAPIRPVGNSSLQSALPPEDRMTQEEYKRARASGKIGLSDKARREHGYGV